jgi:hypothetical protein
MKEIPEATAKAWYERTRAGDTYQQIATSAGETYIRVRDRITKYRKKHNLPPSNAKAQRKKSSTTERRAACPKCLAAIKKDMDDKKCIWWDGDIREGNVVLCGEPRWRRDYCEAHHTRCFVKPSRVNVPENVD